MLLLRSEGFSTEEVPKAHDFLVAARGHSSVVVNADDHQSSRFAHSTTFAVRASQNTMATVGESHFIVFAANDYPRPE